MGSSSSQYPQRTKPRKDSIQGWNCSATLLSIEGGLPVFEGDLEECSYNNETQKQHFDKNGRYCLRQLSQEERFTKATEPILKKYFEPHQHKLAIRDNQWEIYRCETHGFFPLYYDRKIKAAQEGVINVAIELLLPPKSLCVYKGGQLIIYEDQYVLWQPTITADDKKWTHIILPLGISYQVYPVHSNYGILCRKQVFVERMEGLEYSVMEGGRKYIIS